MKVHQAIAILGTEDPDAEVFVRDEDGQRRTVSALTTMVLPDTSALTPSEELLLELLVARTRLGHDWWTIASNATSRRAAETLERLGVIRTMHGLTENTLRARLTEAQRFSIDLDSSYLPPILGGHA
ncbi:hypothetical protein [Gordonia sp. MMO-8]|uniref:hypothetical protein n=1 Tax=Gordonia sp. MMO-8 TaxID=3127886 RepID=UPI0030189A35